MLSLSLKELRRNLRQVDPDDLPPQRRAVAKHIADMLALPAERVLRAAALAEYMQSIGIEPSEATSQDLAES
jgi:hypothetical protein